MKIAIIDADLIGRSKHRFPNLACEKISGYHKELGNEVVLKLDYENLEEYDRVYISKVFTDTIVPDWISENVNTETGVVNLPEYYYIGGTGFFFDKAPGLPEEIEHHMPDYHLYDEWIESKCVDAEEDTVKSGKVFDRKAYLRKFKEYTDYSIGFMTRGCFRKCPFCVNQKYDRVFLHSPLEEFYDPERKKICLLDDNILGCPEWKSILNTLIGTGKPFKFKQGLDERILTDEKCEMLFNANYDGEYIFAFDNIADYELIQRKLEMIRRHTDKRIMFYVLSGFESTDVVDIESIFKRIDLLMKYKCLPYIMRYQNKNETPWKQSEMRGMYISLARWCNQPSLFKRKSFREYSQMKGNEATARYLAEFEKRYPQIAEKYFDIKWNK